MIAENVHDLIDRDAPASQLREVVIMGPQSGFPSFYMKEGVLLDVAAKPGSLSITLAITAIPAVSEWGMVVMTLFLVIAGTLVLRPSQPTTARGT